MTASRFRAFVTTGLLAALFAGPLPARGDNEGQEDLDSATSLKLGASTMADLEKVVELAESAIEKGLDEENTVVAKSLITATLFQHGSRFAQALFNPRERAQRPAMLKQFALRDLAKILTFNDELPRVHMMIARLESVDATGRGIRPEGFERGKKSADRAVELLAEDKPLLSQALVLRAGYQRGEAQMADINRAIEVDPNNVDAWRLRGKSRLVRGEFLAATGRLDEAQRLREQALEDFQTLLEKNADDGDALQAVAELLGRLGNYEEAIAKASEAIERNRRSASLYRLRARLYRSEEQYADAIKDLNRAIDLQPDNYLAFLDRCNVHFDEGDKKAAAKDFSKAFELREGLTQTVLQSITIQSQGKSDNIIKELGRYAEIDELSAEADGRTPTQDYRVELGRAQLFSQQPVDAISTLTVLLDREPKKNDRYRQSALRIRGDAYLGIGKHREAITDYRAAKKISERDDGVLNNLAWVLATSPIDELRDAQEAIKLAELACQVTNYKEAHILSTLAAAHAEAGDFPKALEISQQAVKLSEETEGTSEETRTQLKNELESYQQNKPWRELQDATKEQPEVSGPADTPAAESPASDTDAPAETDDGEADAEQDDA